MDSSSYQYCYSILYGKSEIVKQNTYTYACDSVFVMCGHKKTHKKVKFIILVGPRNRNHQHQSGGLRGRSKGRP